MIHFVLLLVCVLSVEVFIRFNFLLILDSILRVIRKVIYVIPQDNISDHWKEKVVPSLPKSKTLLSVKILLSPVSAKIINS